MSDRRLFLKLLSSLPLSVVLASPRISRAVAAALETVTETLPDGRAVTGVLAVPEGPATGGILLVHEWWGLNDQIKAMAAELAREGYVALAVDLYAGKVAADPDRARALMQAVDPGVATTTVGHWVRWLRAHENTAGKVATIGWCFGGGWSLNASLAAPVDATVVYYGNVDKTAAELAGLNGPVLGHFATEDNWIDRDMVGRFEAAMDTAGKGYTSHWYEAQHAFANPTSARYDAGDAALAWRRTLDFLRAQLVG